jgi:hypothetical protein
MTDLNPELQKRLSSWRNVAGVVEHPSETLEEASINEAQVRIRQRRITNMSLNTVKAHSAFVADLTAFVENEKAGRDLHHQSRVEDFAAFALGVFEQFSAENLHIGLNNELDGLPKEIIETITIPAPQPPKSWFQRVLGI